MKCLLLMLPFRFAASCLSALKDLLALDARPYGGKACPLLVKFVLGLTRRDGYLSVNLIESSRHRLAELPRQISDSPFGVPLRYARTLQIASPLGCADLVGKLILEPGKGARHIAAELRETIEHAIELIDT